MEEDVMKLLIVADINTELDSLLRDEYPNHKGKFTMLDRLRFIRRVLETYGVDPWNT